MRNTKGNLHRFYRAHTRLFPSPGGPEWLHVAWRSQNQFGLSLEEQHHGDLLSQLSCRYMYYTDTRLS